MFHTSRSAARRAWLPMALAAAVACKQGPAPEVQARLDSLNLVAQQRERMVQELADQSRFLSEISAELAKVRAPIKQLRVSRESPLRASRDSLIQRVRFITEKVNESDAKLKASEQRIRELSTLSDSLRTTLGETVTNYQTVIASQKETIDQLTEQINQFSADKVALVDSVNQLQEKLNTVYYVIGTKDDLLKSGIIVKEGGSRFLFVLWKSGQTLQPARELDPAAFAAGRAGSRHPARRPRRDRGRPPQDRRPRRVLENVEVPDPRRELRAARPSGKPHITSGDVGLRIRR